MAEALRRGPTYLPVTLILAAFGGALAGGVFSTGLFVVANPGSVIGEPVQAFALPLMIGGVSLLFVLPATVLFGLPVALLVERKAAGRWIALAQCLGGAAIAQVVTHWLFLTNDYWRATDLWFSAPFALGAALVLWWRLTRTA